MDPSRAKPARSGFQKRVQSSYMPTFCDVALPVPLDMAFTYRIAGPEPVVGGRVLVPFRAERLSGVVTALHDRAPSMPAKAVLQVLDTEPVLDEGLMQLGQWIAQ